MQIAGMKFSVYSYNNLIMRKCCTKFSYLVKSLQSHTCSCNWIGASLAVLQSLYLILMEYIVVFSSSGVLNSRR